MTACVRLALHHFRQSGHFGADGGGFAFGGGPGGAGLGFAVLHRGTGFFGRSSVGENIGPQHLVQWTRIAYSKAGDVPFPSFAGLTLPEPPSRPRLPVGKIGESLGFSSPAYFTRTFLHLTGKSPTEFRRSA